MGNIITVNMNYGCCRTEQYITDQKLYQYDYGQILKLTGIDLPAVYEVHFSNGERGTSTTGIGTTDGVEIPDQYLLNAGKLYVWLYTHTTEDDGETELGFWIPIIPRAQPTHEEPTPVQQSEIERLIALCEEIVEHGGGSGGGGSDGFSPVVTVTEITGGHRISIQDKTHTATFDVMDGTDGRNGTNGTNGTDGTDGVSPTVTIAEITGGHRVTITDKDHPSGMQFDVMDGADGTDASLPTGSSSSDILVWGGTWTPTDFSTFVTENITAITYQFTATGMTDGSTITSANSAANLLASVNGGLEHQYLIPTGQDSAISLQPYTLTTDQNGVHLGLYTILDGSLYYALLTAASANTVLTGTLHVVDLTAKELPTVSSSDEGKFLRVSSQGTWIADTVPSAEGVGF